MITKYFVDFLIFNPKEPQYHQSSKPLEIGEPLGPQNSSFHAIP